MPCSEPCWILITGLVREPWGGRLPLPQPSFRPLARHFCRLPLPQPSFRPLARHFSLPALCAILVSSSRLPQPLLFLLPSRPPLPVVSFSTPRACYRTRLCLGLLSTALRVP